MPISKKPRSKDSNRSATNRRMLQIINEAQSLDRRRQAQIENQKQSITRLLERFDTALSGTLANPHLPIPTSHAVYGEEMEVLHQAAAAAIANEQETREVLRELVRLLDADPADMGPAAQEAMLSEALTHARQLVGLSAPVSESKGEAG